MTLRDQLPELRRLEGLLEGLEGARVRELARVRRRGETLPIHCIEFGPEDRSKPAFALIGGVHGLERVGSQVVLSYLNTLKVAHGWDQTVRDLLTRVRLFFVPIVNPIGMALHYRANGNGVDLMRNAPVAAEEPGPWYHAHQGQRLTRWLPWYRGDSERMEVEAQALCDFVRQEIFPSQFGMVLDVHSGFLKQDRIWFPYARSKRLFHNAAEVLALKHLLGETHSYHRYRFEPQAINYTTHGDLWDYLHDEHSRYLTSNNHTLSDDTLGNGTSNGSSEQSGGHHPRLFLPLTLEISSASWYRKNPGQLLSRLGLFHPVKPHRLTRVLRRHKLLFDFLFRAVDSYENWLPRNPERRESLSWEAESRWGQGSSSHVP